MNPIYVKMKEHYQLPVLTEKDEDGFYVVECPVFSGCYSQGETMDEALKNICEVIDLCLEEKDNRLRIYYGFNSFPDWENSVSFFFRYGIKYMLT